MEASSTKKRGVEQHYANMASKNLNGEPDIIYDKLFICIINND